MPQSGPALSDIPLIPGGFLAGAALQRGLATINRALRAQQAVEPAT
jgi:hypothetical protein